ncbi:hypothetical protein BJV78DRAFT_866940 [Lactifluus subvellereus]|nr:hypothetical protein BJV78DRAFT_866940 [Lactifluus subvellereus]
MPGPVIYVAVAISAVAAVIVFKEFVYDPHFRPRFSSWRESRQRRKAKPHARTGPSSSSDSDDGKPSGPRRASQGHRSQFMRSAESTPNIELQHLIASEVETLGSSAETEGDNTGIRLRRVGDASRLRDPPVGNTSSQSERNDSTSQPLISLDGRNASNGDKAPPIMGPNNRTSEFHVPSSRLPPPTGTHVQSSIQQAIQQDNTSGPGHTLLSFSTRGSISLQTPIHVEIPRVPETLPIFGHGDLPTPTPMASGDLGNTGPSSPGTDLLDSSDVDMLSVDQYLTPRDLTLSPHNGTTSPTLSSNLSIDLLSSPSFSPPGSPFFDAGAYHHELMGSRSSPAMQRSEAPNGGISSTGLVQRTHTGADFFPAVQRDSEVFSLPSQVSSDMGSDEGDYDNASLFESEVSNWISDVADGEGATHHA